MKMLICSIGSQRTLSTLRFATEVARALGAETTYLGVVSRGRRVAKLQRVMERFTERLGGERLPCEVRVDVGRAEEVVMAEMEAASYDLVALGTLSGKRSRKRFLNPVGMCIIERASSSVLIVKGSRPGLSKVLICSSGSELSHFPVQAGAALACAAGARATVLHVVDALPAMYTGLDQMEETLAELLQSDTEMAKELRWATKVVGDVCESPEIKLRRGIVVEEILREVHTGDYDLIVLGSSQGASGIVRALMGDLTREVVSRAKVPVLVVGPPDS
ncbi:universal stress protein [Chloroflexota bacterium]